MVPVDRLAAQCNHAYTTTSHDLRWAQFQTKTFNIAFMPGTAEYLIGQTANKDGSADSSNNNTNLVTTKHLYDAQHSNLQANLSVWQDLRKALVQMKSQAGQVMVWEANTSVTVRDYPDRVATMARFITELNRTLSQQVNVKVHVIDVGIER